VLDSSSELVPEPEGGFGVVVVLPLEPVEPVAVDPVEDVPVAPAEPVPGVPGSVGPDDASTDAALLLERFTRGFGNAATRTPELAGNSTEIRVICNNLGPAVEPSPRWSS
jgi:hypothetical protein